MPMLRLKAPTSVVAHYFHLFVNRRAYTLQSNRPHPESARHYYYRPKDKKTGRGLSLTPDTIRRHLEGETTIGLYSINPATQCSKWVAVDADYENSLADLLKLSFYFRQDGVESALEKSHRADDSTEGRALCRAGFTFCGGADQGTASDGVREIYERLDTRCLSSRARGPQKVHILDRVQR